MSLVHSGAVGLLRRLRPLFHAILIFCLLISLLGALISDGPLWEKFAVASLACGYSLLNMKIDALIESLNPHDRSEAFRGKENVNFPLERKVD